MTADSWEPRYRPEDYASAGRRIQAFVIDHAFLFCLLLCACTVVVFKLMFVHPPPEAMLDPTVDFLERNRLSREWMMSGPILDWLGKVFNGWLAFCVVYYTLFRRLRGGTLGYRIAGIRLIDARGNTPSMWTLVKRFVLATAATLPLGASYLSCRTDPMRRAWHDRWCGTRLVRKRAVPRPSENLDKTLFPGIDGGDSRNTA